MKRNNHFYSVWSICIVLCTVLAIFCLCFAAFRRTEKPEKTGKTNEFIVETEPPAAEEPPVDEPLPSEEPQSASVRLGETPDAGREYLDKLIFLGDSTTFGIGVYYGRGYTELCPPSQIWTPASGTLTLSYYNIATVVYPETGEEIPIAEAAARAKPEYMVLTLGVNGISFMDEEWFVNDYTALIGLIRDASPDTKIILNSLYPVAASYPYTADINNEKIKAANGWIERIAENTGCRYLNSFESLVGADGNLPEESQNGDGIHLTGEAFTTVMQYIRTHAWQ